ncbi:hypothetical protein D3C86_1789740 [compost metagenome]
MIRPLGTPPMPNAISRPKEPVEIDSIASTVVSPNFIMAPLPYDFSNLSNVSCNAFNLSGLLIFLVLLIQKYTIVFNSQNIFTKKISLYFLIDAFLDFFYLMRLFKVFTHISNGTFITLWFSSQANVSTM